MMRLSLKAAVMSVALLGAVTALPAASQEIKLGYVSVERILRDSAPAKAATQKLEAEFSKRDRELQDLGAKLKAAAERLEKDAPVLGEAERARRQRELAELDRDVQRRQREFREDLNQRRNEELQGLLERAERIVILVLGGLTGWMPLALGVVACYILGTMGMDIAAYIFLSVSMAPAAIQAGSLSPMAVHLFILYYAMLAAITPPVAIAAFVGAAMAQAPPMKVGWMAMRLGAVIFFIPIFFIFHPALVLQGSILEILWFTFAATIGTILLALGLEGYVYRLGSLRVWMRPLLIVGGLLLGWGELLSVVTGFVLVAIVAGVAWRTRPRRAAPVPAT